MATLRISLEKITSEVKFVERKSAFVQNNNVWEKNSAFCSILQGNLAVASAKEQLYEQMTSNPAFTERNIQKANYSRQEQKSLVTYHTLQSLHVCVWRVNTLTSTAPIGSPIICMWSPADVCEQWEKKFIFKFSRRSWGRNAWRTPKNVCVGGYSSPCLPRAITLNDMDLKYNFFVNTRQFSSPCLSRTDYLVVINVLPARDCNNRKRT